MVLTNPREIKEDSERVMLLLQQLRPGFWEQWAEIERNHKPFDAIRKAVIEFLREQGIVEKNGADALSEAQYFSALRKKILMQNGLWLGATEYTREDILKIVEYIKNKRPDLWEDWGRKEENNEPAGDMLWELNRLILEFVFTKDNGDVINIKDRLRTELRRELGLWIPDEEFLNSLK